MNNPLATEQPHASRRHHFEELYQRHGEPWEYSRFAAEVLRHDLVVGTARGLPLPPRPRVLDVGCSLGQLTSRLGALTPDVHAVDISPTAVRQARIRCRTSEGAAAFRFYAASAAELPFAPEAFDLVLLCDGLLSWRLPPEEQEAVLRDVYRITVPGGWVLLTDALKTPQIEPFVERAGRSPFDFAPVRYLNDRLWYSLERATRPVQEWRVTRAALASRTLARLLMPLSALARVRGTKHVCLVGRKPAGEGGGR